MKKTEIITPRMIARTPSLDDVALVSEAIIETWAELHKWLTWADDIEKVSSHEVNYANISENIEKFEKNEQFVFHCFDKNSDKFIGKVDIKVVDFNSGKFKIGYWIRTSETGKGYATEITQALLTYAFKALNATNVQIDYKDGNDASRKVIEKNGFLKIGESEGFHIYESTNLQGIDADKFSFSTI